MGKLIVLLISVPLMIVSLVCVLFSDKIDTAVQGNKEVKKVIVVFGVGTFDFVPDIHKNCTPFHNFVCRSA